MGRHFAVSAQHSLASWLDKGIDVVCPARTLAQAACQSSMTSPSACGAFSSEPVSFEASRRPVNHGHFDMAAITAPAKRGEYPILVKRRLLGNSGSQMPLSEPRKTPQKLFMHVAGTMPLETLRRPYRWKRRRGALRRPELLPTLDPVGRSLDLDGLCHSLLYSADAPLPWKIARHR